MQFISSIELGNGNLLSYNYLSKVSLNNLLAVTDGKNIMLKNNKNDLSNIILHKGNNTHNIIAIQWATYAPISIIAVLTSYDSTCKSEDIKVNEASIVYIYQISSLTTSESYTVNFITSWNFNTRLLSNSLGFYVPKNPWKNIPLFCYVHSETEFFMNGILELDSKSTLNIFKGTSVMNLSSSLKNNFIISQLFKSTWLNSSILNSGSAHQLLLFCPDTIYVFDWMNSQASFSDYTVNAVQWDGGHIQDIYSMGEHTSQYFTAISSDRISTKYDQTLKRIDSQSPKDSDNGLLIDGIHVGRSFSSPSFVSNMPGKRRPSFTLNKYDAAPQSPSMLENNKFNSLPPRSPAVIAGTSVLPTKFLSPKNLKSPPSNLVQYFASTSSPATASTYFSAASSVVSEPDSPTVKVFAKNPTSDLLNSFITAESEKLMQSKSPALPASPQSHFQFNNPKVNRRVSFSDHTDKILVAAPDDTKLECNPIFSNSPTLARRDSDIAESIRKYALEKLTLDDDLISELKNSDPVKRVRSPPPQSLNENECKVSSRRQSIEGGGDHDITRRKLHSPPPKPSEDPEVGEVLLLESSRRSSFQTSPEINQTLFAYNKVFDEKLRSPPPRAEEDPENSDGVSHAYSRRNSFRRSSFLESSQTPILKESRHKLHSPPPAQSVNPDLWSESSASRSSSISINGSRRSSIQKNRSPPPPKFDESEIEGIALKVVGTSDDAENFKKPHIQRLKSPPLRTVDEIECNARSRSRSSDRVVTPRSANLNSDSDFSIPSKSSKMPITFTDSDESAPVTFAIDGVPVLPSVSPRVNSASGTPLNKSPRASSNREVKVFSLPISSLPVNETTVSTAFETASNIDKSKISSRRVSFCDESISPSSSKVETSLVTIIADEKLDISSPSQFSAITSGETVKPPRKISIDGSFVDATSILGRSKSPRKERRVSFSEDFPKILPIKSPSKSPDIRSLKERRVSFSDDPQALISADVKTFFIKSNSKSPKERRVSFTSFAPVDINTTAPVFTKSPKERLVSFTSFAPVDLTATAHNHLSTKSPRSKSPRRVSFADYLPTPFLSELPQNGVVETSNFTDGSVWSPSPGFAPSTRTSFSKSPLLGTVMERRVSFSTSAPTVLNSACKLKVSHRNTLSLDGTETELLSPAGHSRRIRHSFSSLDSMKKESMKRRDKHSKRSVSFNSVVSELIAFGGNSPCNSETASKQNRRISFSISHPLQSDEILHDPSTVAPKHSILSNHLPVDLKSEIKPAKYKQESKNLAKIDSELFGERTKARRVSFSNTKPFDSSSSEIKETNSRRTSSAGKKDPHRVSFSSLSNRLVEESQLHSPTLIDHAPISILNKSSKSDEIPFIRANNDANSLIGSLHNIYSAVPEIKSKKVEIFQFEIFYQVQTRGYCITILSSKSCNEIAKCDLSAYEPISGTLVLTSTGSNYVELFNCKYGKLSPLTKLSFKEMDSAKDLRCRGLSFTSTFELCFIMINKISKDFVLNFSSSNSEIRLFNYVLKAAEKSGAVELNNSTLESILACMLRLENRVSSLETTFANSNFKLIQRLDRVEASLSEFKK